MLKGHIRLHETTLSTPYTMENFSMLARMGKKNIREIQSENGLKELNSTRINFFLREKIIRDILGGSTRQNYA